MLNPEDRRFRHTKAALEKIKASLDAESQIIEAHVNGMMSDESIDPRLKAISSHVARIGLDVISILDYLIQPEPYSDAVSPDPES